MKKRILLLLIAILTVSFVLLLISCGVTSNNQDKPEAEKSQTTETDIYSKLNTMLKNVSYPVTLTTKTMEDGYSFNGRYVITENDGSYSVEYSYEKLSTFEITENGEIIKPNGFKTTYTGNMKIKDGIIVEQNGTQCNISTETFDIKDISLSESVLSDIETGNGIFSAKISSLQSFVGLSVLTNDASISITYNDTKITKMVLAYSTFAYQTETTYSFN